MTWCRCGVFLSVSHYCASRDHVWISGADGVPRRDADDRLHRRVASLTRYTPSYRFMAPNAGGEWLKRDGVLEAVRA